MATYTVKKGDTLSEIAEKYNPTYHYGNTNREAYLKLAEINDIDDPDYIVVGQVLELDPNKTVSKKTTKASKAEIKAFGLQSNSDRTVYASWAWSKSNTKEYRVIWYYDTGDGLWFVGTDSTVTVKQSIYNAPANAKRVQFKVLPVSDTHKVNDKDVNYWTASWSTVKSYSFSDNPPSVPSVPTVKIEKYKLTASLSNLDINATTIEFQVVKDDKTVFANGKATIATTAATYSCNVTAGGKYKVRCRGVRGKVYGDWSEYSDNVETIPAASGGITTIKALSETSVTIDWEDVKNCTSYEVEYTTNKSYFDSNSNEVKKVTVESVVGHAEITGMETGQEYFFRVRAVNAQGSSAWTEIKSIIIGKKPSAPTTWSSTTTAITGEALTLYWVHNAEDGSSQTYAELELYINGLKETHTIENTNSEEDKDKTSFYPIDTSEYIEGTQIQWRVRTAGITLQYGDWSVQRTVDIYAPATLELTMTDVNDNALETVTSFPFYIKGLAGPNTQRPIGYSLVVTSNSIYETVDQIGNKNIINAGEAIYTQYFDISDPLLVEFSAGNIDLENNIEYTVTCTASMNSGLKAESSLVFTVSWDGEEYEPNAEVGIDEDSLTASIRPYCEDELGNLIPDLTLSVYRREFDGSFTELATGIENTYNEFITDPHPALDYARYRIVAISKVTGAVSYYDMPGYPVGEKAVIIQWDEAWTSFESSTEDESDPVEQPEWAGSLLKLPYNINVSDKNAPDVSLVKYIGRKRPVSYYGTQLGETSSWSMDIAKDDRETLYALRRLAIWMGDVYVREPSGSGYWANISVSFSQTHRELVIPVTLEITRVEGGM